MIFKQLTVKLPEFSLVARSQCRHGALVGELMVGEREVLDHIANVIGIFFQQLLDIALKASTVGSLVVIKYHDGDFRILRSFYRPAGQIDIVYAAKADNFEP